MATKTSFKQQCPSCEAMVPIRDPSLVGRKIDCPKCKYRFVVEEPADAITDEAPAKPAKKGAVAGAANGKAKAGAKASAKADPDEKGGKKGSKGEKKSNSTMIIGVGLAVVALGLVGVGACFMFGVFDDDKKPAKADKKDDKKPPVKPAEDDKKPDKDEPAPSGPNITNLLPNDSQAVVYFNNSGKDGVPVLVPGSNVADVLFRNGAFDPTSFENRFGFPLSNVEQIAVAINHDRSWSFGVIRTKKPITKQTLTNLNLAPKPKVEQYEYFVVKGDLDPLGVALFKNLKIKETTLHLYDSNTLVLADERQMEQFLQGKREPPNRTKPPAQPKDDKKDPPQGGGMGGGGPPGGGMGGGPPGGGMGGGGPPGGGMGGGGPPGGGMGGGGPPGGGMGGGSGPPGGGMGGGPPGGGMGGGPPGGGMGGGPPGGGMGGSGMPGGGGMGGQAGTAVTASDSFLTVSPVLKRVFDNLEFKKRAITLAIDKRTTDMLIGQLVLAGYSEELAELDVDADKLKDLVETPFTGCGVSLREFSTSRLTVGVALEFDRRDRAVGLERFLRSKSAAILKEIETETGIKVTLVGGSGGGGAGMGGGGPPGGIGGGGPPGGIGGGGPPGGGGSAPPGGIGGGGPPGGGSGPPGGIGGGGPPGGGGGGPPGGGFMGGSGPPGGGRPGGGGEPDEKASKIDLKVNEKMFVVGADIHFTDVPQIVERIKATLAEGAVVLKNEASMIYHHSHLHQLAAGLKKYATDRKQFPRGTAARARKEAGALPYRPDERIAWTAELLTYIDKPAYEDLKIDSEKSWNEGDNQLVASLAIPYYLAADEPAGSYPAGSWRHLAPGTRSPVAAIHFVGIAGIGLDAAEYQAGNPATAKKLGIFGYDRETKVADITDGLDQTIALIQVPPSFKTCWLSGGGGTIRGVAEEDSVTPFVCVTYKGKRGTFAIMADGKVRFIAADMKPETFKALCTIAGGDKIDNLNEVAPIVPNTSTTLKPTLPGDLPKPPAEGPKPPVEGPKPPQAEGNFPEGWERVTDKAGRYSVALRKDGTERKMQQNLPPPLGNVTMHFRGMQFGKAEGALTVVYCDFPPDTLTGGRKVLFDGVVAGLSATLGKPTSEKEITILGHPGRELQIDTRNGPMKVRMILAGNRLYQLMAGGKPSMISDKDVQTFMDSFKITD